MKRLQWLIDIWTLSSNAVEEKEKADNQDLSKYETPFEG